VTRAKLAVGVLALLLEQGFTVCAPRRHEAN
jgi:hypothetical protein